jgi:hypothetical protein
MPTTTFYPPYPFKPAPPARHPHLGMHHGHGASHANTTATIGPVWQGQHTREGSVRLKAPNGQPITDWQWHHERLMHGFWVSSQLGQFQHFHPAVNTQNGRVTWPNVTQPGYIVLSGHSKRWGMVTAQQATGGAAAKPWVSSASTLTKQGVMVSSQPTGLQAAWLPSHNGQNTEWQLGVYNVQGWPLPRVEPLMGSPAHMLGLTPEGQFRHVHPNNTVYAAGSGLPLQFSGLGAGLAKAWVQVQFEGQVFTFAF